ncbi:Mpo1-like protein [Thalassotalea litorea]|uniref:Mpo1-like protein n=1 Tax=Thalassotalea litorea TaxID=2020715 RepID=UPI0037360D63
MTDKKYQTFREFYPFYLSQHEDKTCRALHYIGSLLVIATMIYILVTGKALYLLLLPILGYGFAWVGHFFFEKNRPATFIYPWFSFLGDWVMLAEFITGRKLIEGSHS